MFLEERELYLTTISLLINVPFPGSGLNGGFLPVFYLFIYLCEARSFFSQSSSFSNEISLSCYFSLCITFLMICNFFFHSEPRFNKFSISQWSTLSKQRRIWTRTLELLHWRLRDRSRVYSLAFCKDLHFLIRLSKSCKSEQCSPGCACTVPDGALLRSGMAQAKGPCERFQRWSVYGSSFQFAYYGPLLVCF